MDEFTEEDWEVPEYLQNIYSMWSILGESLAGVAAAHKGAHACVEGYLDPDTELPVPPDLLMAVVLDREIQFEEASAPVHEVLVAVSNGLHLVLAEMVEYLREGEMLPPWWPIVEEKLRGDDAEEA